MEGEFSDKELEKILSRTGKWGKEFSKSAYAERLEAEAKNESQFVLETFAEYMYSYHGSSPEGWDEADLEECCLETLPRKISSHDAYFKSIAPVLSAFFAFAEERKLLKNAPILAQKVQAISRQIEKNASNPKSWGPAKSLVMAAQESGVDVTNQKEMNRFIALYNERLLSERTSDDPPSKAEPVRNPKIGRNEPCPCGSGKKYKKCCGR
jgi:uncharacterized protein YecA (UPF0149 family)